MIDVLFLLAMLCVAIDWRDGQYIILIAVLVIIGYRLGVIIEKLDIVIKLLGR